MHNDDHTMLSLQPGDSLCGRYQLEGVLGQGGMGAVWLATDTHLDRPVAIKVLPTALSRDKRAVARLKEEAKRNLDLTHPNIVRLHTFEQDPARGNAAFLVMQYVEGETLNDLLADHPEGLPLDRVRPWFEQVGQAIDFAHSRGVLHRDVKPANIMIEAETCTAYLMDFGIAAEARDTMTRVTGAQDSSGTLPYMSPQQLMGKNHKSNDVYSFAATLYEALCGRPPFHTGDIAHQIRHAEPDVMEGMPDTIITAIAAGLHKDTTKRPATCAALLSASAADADSSCEQAAQHGARKTVLPEREAEKAKAFHNSSDVSYADRQNAAFIFAIHEQRGTDPFTDRTPSFTRPEMFRYALTVRDPWFINYFRKQKTSKGLDNLLRRTGHTSTTPWFTPDMLDPDPPKAYSMRAGWVERKLDRFTWETEDSTEKIGPRRLHIDIDQTVHYRTDWLYKSLDILVANMGLEAAKICLQRVILPEQANRSLKPSLSKAAAKRPKSAVEMAEAVGRTRPYSAGIAEPPAPGKTQAAHANGGPRASVTLERSQVARASAEAPASASHDRSHRGSSWVYWVTPLVVFVATLFAILWWMGT